MAGRNLFAEDAVLPPPPVEQAAPVGRDLFAPIPNAPPAQTVEQDQGFLAGVGQDLSRRGEAITSSFDRAQAGEITGLERDLNVTAQAILGAGDVGLRGLDAAAQGLENITPEPIRNVVNQFEADVSNFASEQIDALLDTDIGQAGLELFQEGGEAYAEFKEENPRVAQQVENAAIIGSTALGGVGGRAASSGAGGASTGSLRRIAQGVDNRIALPSSERIDTRIGGNSLINPQESGELSTGRFTRGEPFVDSETNDFIDADFDEILPETKNNDSFFRKMASGLDNRISVQIAARRQNFLENLLEPKSTPTSRSAQGARKTETGSGFFRRGSIEPSPEIIRLSNVITKIPGVSNKKTITGNKVEIQKALRNEVDQINEKLVKFNTFIPKNRITDTILKIENCRIFKILHWKIYSKQIPKNFYSDHNQ